MWQNYFYVIKKDFISCEDIPSAEGKSFGYPEAKNLCEKKNIPAIPFKLFDADKNLYYQGVIWCPDPDSEEIFAPLYWSHWGAGCTTMKLFENGKWSAL